MNYFGHAALALETSSDPKFVLGSMLPDLASMLRMPCPSSLDEVVSSGLAFHHLTDAVFHQTETFSRLNQEALRVLRDLGMRRGPARATAHIGTEMLLDALLTTRASYGEGYVAALSSAPLVPLVWCDDVTRASFTVLAAHLEERGVEAHRADPDRLVFRLGRALEGRARLEPDAAELPMIARFGEVFAERVAAQADELLGEVRAGIAARTPHLHPF